MQNATTTCEYEYNDSSTPQIASSQCYTVYGKSTSTDPSISNGFTYGEIVISVLLFLVVVAVIYAFTWFTTAGVKIRQ
jgi:ABC-type uncharacterized transport system permease subunit